MSISKWPWTALGVVALVIIAGWLYVVYSPTIPVITPVINTVNSLTTVPPSPAETQNSAARSAATNLSVVVSSPKIGDSYCVGDVVPIRWSAPKTAQSFSVKASWSTGSNVITSVAGNTAQFSNPVYYDYQWDQKNTNGAPYAAGAGYFIQVIARMKDGSSSTGRSSTFSITTCPKTSL
jgi:hypothetical protein